MEADDKLGDAEEMIKEAEAKKCEAVRGLEAAQEVS
jgi:hypothetical protein